MYLENRDPLPININPQLTWKPDPNPAKMNQAQRAASLLASTVRFKRTLRDGHLKVVFNLFFFIIIYCDYKLNKKTMKCLSIF